MEEGSTGALIPAVRSELKTGSSDEVPAELIAGPLEPTDKELLCPICMQIIKDAFLTSCGHSFCYMCIITHLDNKSDCPCCASSLTANQLYPNFLLDKLLKKTSASQVSKSASPLEQFRQTLLQGYEVSVKELDTLLSLLSEKKRKLEQEEAEKNMQNLLDFLQCLRKRKIDELNEVQTDVQYIKEDISLVERRRIELYRARDRYMMKMQMHAGELTGSKSWSSSSIDKENSNFMFASGKKCGGVPTSDLQYMNADGKSQASSIGTQRKEASSGLSSQHTSQSSLAVMRKIRVKSQFNDLQQCYLQKRRQLMNRKQNHDKNDVNVEQSEGYSSGLSDFQSVLSTFTQYSRLRVIAELRHGELFHSANIVSSIEFDCDDEMFATAGVSRRIKVFDFSTVVNEPPEAHCPVVEIPTRSKLSCLSWNKHTKNHIASSDYEGTVIVWDVNTRQSVMEYEEHEKRVWSVDFSAVEPSMLVSGSDDCKVKVWCTKQESSAINIDMKANICCVKYNPGSSTHIAVGSVDHHIHYYDLRNTRHPIHIFSGHQKTVSYVKFLSNDELASASTDSTLRLWDVKRNLPVRTFRGHTNEKNFVGLSVNNDFLACGSETNEVYGYHKAISKPLTWHRFGTPNVEDSDDEAGSYFISAVCWKSDSPTMLAANSLGTIKVLVLAP
ncbi:E3 ubiquitin-protein ligase COP1-like [Rutidosis leptorrhynchoides]|uniref:E3 ubiquitin-protein ligase COP1-like n=1 Tax=Rutidosis leptorrhynchoides TaxID=125765 RepID=UPI003A99BE1F